MISIRKHLSNIIGWRTSGKIVVFESDDWGSIRTRSKSDFDAMLSEGVEIDRSIYTSYDCLESNNDLENLYDVLSRHKDSSARSAVFTPMCIMANPDFTRIKESGFTKYHYESFVDTCKRYPNHDKVPQLWRDGIENRLFVPGFHGREHFNVNRWLQELRKGNEGLLVAFEHESIGVSSYKGNEIPEYLGAFHPDRRSDIHELDQVIITGAELFEKNCGYKPEHFIAPNRETPKELDRTLCDAGIKYLTMSKLRHYPLGDDKFRWQFNWLGKKNEYNQIILIRNCHFEPADSNPIYCTENCLKEIEIAFKWGKPAIISTHRVNYTGSIDPHNADKGLKELDTLLTQIMKIWPDVNIMTSSELGELISLS
jgi:hypothetical protein